MLTTIRVYWNHSYGTFALPPDLNGDDTITLVHIDLRTTNHLGVYETVKAIDLKFEGPYVSPQGFVVMPTEFTAPYNPRSEHDYVMILDLVPGTWTIAGLKVVVPESDTPVNLVDLLEPPVVEETTPEVTEDPAPEVTPVPEPEEEEETDAEASPVP